MGIVLAVCIFTYILQRNHLKSEHHIESLVSRESSFLFNNLVLLTACFVILWGTLFPILSEYVQGTKVTVGAPFYNRVAIPIGLFLLFLTGVGPLLPWRATSLQSIRRNFIVPSIALWGTVIVCLAVGVRPWKDGAFDSGNFYALVAFALSAGVLTAIFSEFFRGAGVISRQTDRNLFAAMYLLIRRNTRRYGGYMIHIGVVIVVIGLAGAAFNRSNESEMALHGTMTIGPYTLDAGRRYSGLEPQLQLRVRAARCLPERQERIPDDAGKARLPGQRSAADHGRHSFRSRLGFVCRL